MMPARFMAGAERAGRGRSRRRLLVVGLLVGVVFGLFVGGGVASAAGVWWGVSSGVRPTALQAGSAASGVQEIVTSQEVGFILSVETAPGVLEEVGLFVTEPFYNEFKGEPGVRLASAAHIQSALEKVPSYGAGTVVSGGELEEGRPLTVTTGFGKPVPPLRVAALLGEGEARVLSRGVASGVVVATAQNLGDMATSGAVTFADRLPAGFQPVAIEAIAGGPASLERQRPECELATLKCRFAVSCSKKEALETRCVLPAFEEIEMRITVALEAGVESGENVATVSGGGAAGAVSAGHLIGVGGVERFGVEDWQQVPEDEGGTVDTRAGSHPFQLTSVVTLNSSTPDSAGHPRSVGLPKTVTADLPAGLIGNPTPFAQCTDAQFAAKVQVKETHGEGTTPINECPADSAIGVATVTVNEPVHLGFVNVTAPIFNMVPGAGEPARFGFKVGGIVPVFLDTSIRTGSDYGVSVSAVDIPQISWLLSSKLTFWGVPGAAAHDGQRGWDCLLELGGPGACPASTETSPPPFIVMPTSCATPFEATMRAVSWPSSGQPGETAQPVTYRLAQAVDGCNHLPFSPSIRVAPDGSAASSPTGLSVDVHVPQEAVLNAESLAEAAVKEIQVALPEGVAVNPSGSDGLLTCSESEVGYLAGESQPPNDLRFTPTVSQAFCPDASKVGTVKITTPLLPKGQDVTGAVYLAAQNENPFGSLIAMYIVAEDPVSGAVVKLAGETQLTETGQLRTTFKDSPQLAFEDAELHFFGGERAPLSTPARCGAYTTTASFAPWSGNEPVASTSTFDITSGPHDTPCPTGNLPFSPSLTGGVMNINAGAFSQLSTTITRQDGQQNIQTVRLHMPAGLEGLLTSIALCPQTQAENGSCGPESLIGETTVSAGVGGDPVSVKGGRVYLTEGYDGAPFGLSIVNPVKAGPFDLEHDTSNAAQQPACDCIVVRAKIEVDPHTAQLTITTNPIPNLIDGVPVQIQKVNVTINRPHFTFNPTNCQPLQITGALTGYEQTTSPLEVPFQVTNCALLKFTPTITVSTNAKASRLNGVNLNFKISYPKDAMGTQSWFNEAKFTLPKQLPARLSTIQQACLATVFETNPDNCPGPSKIGQATVHTPVLPVPLTGPVYFISHGGAKFPDAVFLLHGYGITIELHGETYINSKTGITSATFKNTPDVPFETIEVNLPAGPYSEFGANLPHQAKNSFCNQHLTITTNLKAQNGLQTNNNTPIKTNNCPKHTTTHTTHHHKHHT